MLVLDLNDNTYQLSPSFQHNNNDDPDDNNNKNNTKSKKEAFIIDKETGEIKTGLDFSRLSSANYRLLITASDRGLPPLASTLRATVLVDSGLVFYDDDGMYKGGMKDWFRNIIANHGMVVLLFIVICSLVIVVVLVAAILAVKSRDRDNNHHLNNSHNNNTPRATKSPHTHPCLQQELLAIEKLTNGYNNTISRQYNVNDNIKNDYITYNDINKYNEVYKSSHEKDNIDVISNNLALARIMPKSPYNHTTNINSNTLNKKFNNYNSSTLNTASTPVSPRFILYIHFLNVFFHFKLILYTF